MVQMDSLQRAIVRRQDELHKATRILAKSARKYALLSSLGTALTVTLGALVATRDTALSVFPQWKEGLAVTYMLTGVVIASTAGLEAAFRLKDKSAKLHALAATIEAIWRKIDTRWRKEVRGGDGEEQFQAAQRLIDLQDETLEQTSRQAAELGINLPLELGELAQWENVHAA